MAERNMIKEEDSDLSRFTPDHDRTYQWRIQGPGLSVRNLNVTSSPSPPAETTSRRTCRTKGRVIDEESTRGTLAHRVDIVVFCASSRSDDVKGMLKKKDGTDFMKNIFQDNVGKKDSHHASEGRAAFQNTDKKREQVIE